MENPSTPESNWGICLRDFWIERIMHCVPCIFCELRGRGVCVFYVASFYFRDVAFTVCGLVEYPCWVCWESVYFFSPANCRYIHKHGGGAGQKKKRDVFSVFSLGALAPKYACIFISRHKRIYWLRFLIRISTLCYAHDKKKSYNTSIIIIYSSCSKEVC